MKETIRLGGFLMIVCVLASLGLALTNKSTAPIIEKQKQTEKQAALKEVLPAAKDFELQNNPGKEPAKYYMGKDANGEKVGVVFEAAPKGYGGPVNLVVGVDNQGAVTGIKTMEMTETPGLGAKSRDAAFTDQFKGKTAEQLYLKNKDEKAGEVDAITSATITSKAVTGGVRRGVEGVQHVLP